MNNIQNIIKIEIPTWLAFPPLNTINVYLIKDEPYTLIDAGPKMPHNLEILKNALKNQGINLKDIKRLLITHGQLGNGNYIITLAFLSVIVIIGFIFFKIISANLKSK